MGEVGTATRKNQAAARLIYSKLLLTPTTAVSDGWLSGRQSKRPNASGRAYRNVTGRAHSDACGESSRRGKTRSW
eukprot:6209202-Pleurochrysis_carterae.AAC.1